MLLLLIACRMENQAQDVDKNQNGGGGGTDSGVTSGEDSGGGTGGAPAVWEAACVGGVEDGGRLLLSTRDRVQCVATDTANGIDGTASSTWDSTDADVLACGADGGCQPLGIGTATITYTLPDGQTGAVDVEVTSIAIPEEGELSLNEINADAAADANADGNIDAVEDEFIEIANAAGITLDLSGLKLIETGQPTEPRHTFEDGTLLGPGEAVVVFGGGDPRGLRADNVTFLIVDNSDSGLQLGLALNNEGDTLRLLTTSNVTVTSMTYGNDTTPAADDCSLVLSPEIEGTSYLPHIYASGSVGAFSPGTLADGSAFPGFTVP